MKVTLSPTQIVFFGETVNTAAGAVTTVTSGAVNVWEQPAPVTITVTCWPAANAVVVNIFELVFCLEMPPTKNSYEVYPVLLKV